MQDLYISDVTDRSTHAEVVLLVVLLLIRPCLLGTLSLVYSQSG